jgi:hypothetical protein
MPNWCNNSLIVIGDQQTIDDFKSKTVVMDENGNENFTMKILLPCPKELEEMTSPAIWRGEKDDTEGKEAHEKYVAELKEKYGHSDWYEWCIKNWGTKWDVGNSSIMEENEKFVVDYSTAWGPNSTWVHTISKFYPTLEFKLIYEEPGMDFCGCYEVKNGGDDYEDLQEGDLEWIDWETDRMVKYDKELDRYRYVDTDEVIDDEDFCPSEHNPYA